MKKSRKKYTIDQKIEICERAIAVKKEGGSLPDFATNQGITKSALYKWIRDYKTQKTNVDEPEIPTSLISEMTKEFNNISDDENIGSVKIDMVDVLVYSQSVENSIRVSVEKPDTDDIKKFSAELSQRILDELQWCFAMKGFKFDD
jgi:transposase-like protein